MCLILITECRIGSIFPVPRRDSQPLRNALEEIKKLLPCTRILFRIEAGYLVFTVCVLN